VIFDFDGTLVDTMEGFADIAAGVIHRRYGMDWKDARRQYLKTSGLPFRQQLESIFPGDGRNDDASREFEDAKLETFFAERFPREVRDTISGLRSQGYVVAVSSNNGQELVDRFVRREKVPFHAVLGARKDFYKGRDHFHHIRDEFGIPETEMVFVGDSLKDAEKAYTNGVRFVGKTGTFERADFERDYPGVVTVDRISDVPEKLR
jgi:phosphoglycolate phosphatase-like HAD superfamily hydrolase